MRKPKLKIGEHIKSGLLLVGIFMFLTSCWVRVHVEKKELIGKYKCTYPYGMGTEYLYLKEDGTLLQEFVEKDGTIHKNQASWIYHDVENYGTIVVVRDKIFYVAVTGDPEDKGKKGSASFPADFIHGKVRITVNSDLGYIFEKTE